MNPANLCACRSCRQMRHSYRSFSDDKHCGHFVRQMYLAPSRPLRPLCVSNHIPMFATPRTRFPNSRLTPQTTTPTRPIPTPPLWACGPVLGAPPIDLRRAAIGRNRSSPRQVWNALGRNRPTWGRAPRQPSDRAAAGARDPSAPVDVKARARQVCEVAYQLQPRFWPQS